MNQSAEKKIPIIEESLIIKKESWKDFYLLGFESSHLLEHAHPGQFLMVRISSQLHPLLRRPFSIHNSEANITEIFFKATGFGTNLLAQKKTGDKINIFGPLGKGFVLNKDLFQKKVTLVGGGRGVAPLYFLAGRLRDLSADITLYYGGKTSDELPLQQKFIQSGIKTLCSTNDGTFAFKGLVTDLFEEKITQECPDQIFACGPDLMMEKIAKIAENKGIPAQFSLESAMGCGFGVCWGCVKKIRKDNQPAWVKICEEGPVFPRESIIWNSEGK
ncbi:MAG: dihydroorotate dehydrogenase electron transfer subunit [Candidatus Aminicenantes bacterium]|nr:dihydroorotate dehydrogenase electron transfer subunit [Candidatus Aminicenantes bacterium]